MNSLRFVWWLLVRIIGVSFSTHRGRLTAILVIRDLNATYGMVAGVMPMFRYIVFTDKISKTVHGELYGEIIQHEIGHLVRGVITPDLSELQSIYDIAYVYFKEEQAINRESAPMIFSDTQVMWNKSWEQFVIGGLYTLGNRPMYTSRVIFLLERYDKKLPIRWRTHLINLKKARLKS